MAIRRPTSGRSETPAGSSADQPTLAMDGFVTVRIVQLAEIIARGASQVFEQRFGVKNTELRILIQLGGKQPLAVNELARRTRVDKGWISRSLRGLEKRGLVQRMDHPTDSRASQVSLTPKGDQLIRDFAPVAAARNQRLLASLEEGEVHRILEGLFSNAERLLLHPDLDGPAKGGESGARRRAKPR